VRVSNVFLRTAATPGTDTSTRRTDLIRQQQRLPRALRTHRCREVRIDLSLA
jgi:hypothetical protein